MSEKWLSICIPTYNRGNIVEETVIECLKLCTDECEVVVTDNASTDDTYERLSKIHDKNFAYYRNAENIGYENLMQSVKNASGKFRLALCDDDRIQVESLSKLLDYLKAHNNYSLFQFPYFDEDKNILVKKKYSYLKANTYKLMRFVVNKNFYFFGGMILNGNYVDEVWDSAKTEENAYWKLYNHTVIPLFISPYGDYAYIEHIKTCRTLRNEKSNIDNKAITSGNGKEPYWGLGSRREQVKGLFEIIEKLIMPKNIKLRLLKNVYLDIYKVVFWHWRIIFNDNCLQNEIYHKYQWLVLQDREKTIKDWETYISEIRVDVGEEAKKSIRKQGGGKTIEFSLKVWEWIYILFLRIAIRISKNDSAKKY